MAKRFFEPIVPKRKKLIDVGRIQSKLRFELSSLMSDVLRDAAFYEVPPPDPSVYVRTGTLKRSWSKRGPSWLGQSLVGIVASAAPYAVYVRGKKRGRKGFRQARAMARRGWKSITEIVNRHWPSSRRRLIRILQGR